MGISEDLHSTNYYESYFDFINGNITNEIGYQSSTRQFNHLTQINALFYPNKLEDIIQNLKNEDSPFSRFCLDKMNKNSPLSMKIALKMLDEARLKSLTDCLNVEAQVTLSKVKDADFDQGVYERLIKRNREPIEWKMGKPE